MTQTSSTRDSSSHAQDQAHGKASLGPLLCWAVVFADIGSSIYYVPGILYSTVGGLAGFFVLLTMGVFVLLTLKYAEVSQRFPEGGGVVSVAAQAINSWAGAFGGMLILVSYFLTAAISCLSATQYFGVVIPAVLPGALWITIAVLVLLGILNWVGISESAKVSLIGALVAFAPTQIHMSQHALVDGHHLRVDIEAAIRREARDVRAVHVEAPIPVGRAQLRDQARVNSGSPI